MSETLFLIGGAFGPQAALGVADPTIAGLTGALTEADGLVLGDPSAGVGETGYTFTLAPNLREKSAIAGSFSRNFPDFLGTLVSSFEVAIPLKGRGTASPTVDGDYELAQGPNTLLECLGLLGAAWGSGIGWAYTPGAPVICTAKLWLSQNVAGTETVAVVVRDIGATQLVCSFEPGEVGVATFSLAGVYDSHAVEAVPSFDYGNQGSLSSPSIAEVGHNWGMSAAPRGFSTATLTFSNEAEEVPDSNAEAGVRTRATDRTIDFAATTFADDADIDYEITQLQETDIANAEPMDFLVGTAGEANAYQVRLPTPRQRDDLGLEKLGNSNAWVYTLRAHAAAANQEFELIFQ